MIGFAPLVLQILYSSEFVVAAELLRWQIMGDVLKIISWPLGYLLLARGRGKTYMAGEAVATAAFVGVAWYALPGSASLQLGSPLSLCTPPISSSSSPQPVPPEGFAGARPHWGRRRAWPPSRCRLPPLPHFPSRA